MVDGGAFRGADLSILRLFGLLEVGGGLRLEFAVGCPALVALRADLLCLFSTGVPFDLSPAFDWLFTTPDWLFTAPPV